MLFTRIVLAATICAGSVLASSSGSANIAARALQAVVKRDAADDLAAAESIARGFAQSAGEAVASGGKCSTECSDWVGTMGKCVTVSSISESASCICADTAITQMATCGDCLGGENKDGTGSFSKLCSDYAAELGGSSSSSADDSSTTAATSTTPAAESSATSAASSAASAASDALTSAKSAASSVASSAAAGATGAPESGAGKLAVGGSAILAAGVALLVAL